eukprot:NODE_2857_length_633_cov_16.993151_g2377_i0.p1 GENE.NODE_2857_length_633_cov_16.993151_g2377_i0~~NODE_2857_length_633_cov_16.993151_g2377_i0.p1  ORF type:complete len:95 (-),score=9.33 NODE_2857_length_633_cov_16.993151_g2377_i0:324-608(-)
MLAPGTLWPLKKYAKIRSADPSLRESECIVGGSLLASGGGHHNVIYMWVVSSTPAAAIKEHFGNMVDPGDHFDQISFLQHCLSSHQSGEHISAT